MLVVRKEVTLLMVVRKVVSLLFEERVTLRMVLRMGVTAVGVRKRVTDTGYEEGGDFAAGCYRKQVTLLRGRG